MKLNKTINEQVKIYTSFNQNIKLFFTAAFLCSFSFSSFWLLVNFLILEYGYNQTQLGFLNALPSFVVFVYVPIGILIDKYKLSYKKFFLLGCILGPAALLSIVLFPKFYQLIIAFSVIGFSMGLFGLVSMPFMTENSLPFNRTYLFSLQFFIIMLAGFLGSSLAGYMPDIWRSILGDLTSKLILLKYSLFVFSILGIFAVIPVLFIKDAPVEHNEKVREKSKYTSESAKNMIKLLIPLFILGLGAAQVMPFLNIFIKGKFGIDYVQLGWLFAFSNLFMGLAVLAQPILSDKIGKINSVVLVQAVSIPFIIILGFSNVFWLVSLALLIRAALMNMGNPIYNVFAMEKVHSNQRVIFSSLESFLWSGGWAVSSWFSGWIRTLLGFNEGFSLNFILMTALYIVSTSLIYIFWRNTPPQTSRVNASPGEVPPKEGRGNCQAEENI